jgi:hypothetical protein
MTALEPCSTKYLEPKQPSEAFAEQYQDLLSESQHVQQDEGRVFKVSENGVNGEGTAPENFRRWPTPASRESLSRVPEPARTRPPVDASQTTPADAGYP